MATRALKATVPGPYMALMARFRLRPLRTEEDYEEAMPVFESLMMRDDLLDVEDDYAEILAALLEGYEREHHPIRESSGVDLLRFLIEHSERTQSQIAKEAGVAVSTLSEILAGKRGFGIKHMAAFARVFKVDPGFFVTRAPAGE